MMTRALGASTASSSSGSSNSGLLATRPLFSQLLFCGGGALGGYCSRCFFGRRAMLFFVIVVAVMGFMLAEARPRHSVDSPSQEEYNAAIDRVIEEFLTMQLASSLSPSADLDDEPLDEGEFEDDDDDADDEDGDYDEVDTFDNQKDDGVSPVWLPFFVVAPKVAHTKQPQSVKMEPYNPPTTTVTTTKKPQMTTTLDVQHELVPREPSSFELPPSSIEAENDLSAPHSGEFFDAQARHSGYADEGVHPHYLVPKQHAGGITFADVDNHPQLVPLAPLPSKPTTAQLQPISHRDTNTILSSDPHRCQVNSVNVSKCFLGTASSCQASTWTLDVTVSAAVASPASSSVLYLPIYISSVSVSSASPVTNSDDKNFWNRFIQRTTVIKDEDPNAATPLEIRIRVETACCLRQLRIDWLEASSYGRGAHQEPRFCELDLCNGNFCLNRGVCTPTNLCFCQDGWSGKHCERSPLVDQQDAQTAFWKV